MITKFNDFLNEGILDLLKGPNEEEMIEYYKNINNNKLLEISIKKMDLKGLKIAIENSTKDSDTINKYLHKIKRLIIDKELIINSEFFKYLIEQGLECDYDNSFFLRIAAFYGYVDIAKLLLDSGSRVDVLNNQPIIQAAMNGHLDMVKLLEEYGADIHVNDDQPFRIAAITGYYDVVEYCLENDTNPYMFADKDIEWVLKKHPNSNRHKEILKLIDEYKK